MIVVEDSLSSGRRQPIETTETANFGNDEDDAINEAYNLRASQIAQQKFMESGKFKPSVQEIASQTSESLNARAADNQSHQDNLSN